MYCTYKVRKNSFNGKLGYYRLLFWVVTMYSRLVNNKLLPLEVTMSSYHKCYAKNGSHKLTAGFLVYCTYKVRQGLPTLEAMNWRHCIPRVGVHCIESTLCPTVADWSLSDRSHVSPPWGRESCFAQTQVYPPSFYSRRETLSTELLLLLGQPILCYVHLDDTRVFTFMSCVT